MEEIIGSTTKNANGLASSITNSSFVYMAGCVVVVYNVNSGTQLHLMVSNRLPKPLSCVAISQGGNLVAAGEVFFLFIANIGALLLPFCLFFLLNEVLLISYSKPVELCQSWSF